MLSRDLDTARVGQTLRFEITDETVTVKVIRITRRYINGIIECGPQRGKEQMFEKIEMVNCKEIFAYSVLGDIYSAMESAQWESADNSKTKELPKSTPKLNAEFICKSHEKYKRKWHLLRILGEGTEILCKMTNSRGKRSLRKSRSEMWRKRWKDLTNGPRL